VELLIIILLVLLNGFFALVEIALVSSRKIKLEDKARKGSLGASSALDLLKRPEQLLSTMQIGITLIGVVSGAYGGAALTDTVRPFFEQFEALQPYAQQLAFGSTVTFITYLSLVLGELVPKTLGLTNPEGISIILSPFVRILTAIAYPISAFLSFSTRVVLKLLMIREKVESPISEDEVKLMIEQGVQHGTFEAKENEMINSIFKFADRKANSIMTNRRDIIWFDISESIDEMRQQTLEVPHSKIPICDGDIDHILGILPAKEFLRLLNNKEDFDLQTLLNKPVYVPENSRAIKVLEEFRKKRTYTGIVVDEYGSTAGLITLYDLVENIFGDLPDLNDTEHDEWLVVREDGSLLIDAGTAIEDLKDHIVLPEFDEQDEDYTTLAGFAIKQLNHLPKTGERFTVGDYLFEIIDMDFNRVDRILVTPSNKNNHLQNEG
jgi:putative hemolysin